MECAAISSLQRQIAEWALALVLAWLCAPARAQSPDPTKTGRPMQGVNASASYDGETVSDLSGGAKRGSTYHGSLQLQAAFDFERLFGWADTTGFLYGMGLHGGQPDDFTGGAQGVSSITRPRRAPPSGPRPARPTSRGPPGAHRGPCATSCGRSGAGTRSCDH